MDDAIVRPNQSLPWDITRIALDHGLISAYTSFVAVDAANRTRDGYAEYVPIGTALPDGMTQ